MSILLFEHRPILRVLLEVASDAKIFTVKTLAKLTGFTSGLVKRSCNRTLVEQDVRVSNDSV